MTLEDRLWKELQGGYRIKYDASVPLKQLEAATGDVERNAIYDELHLQGEVGLASYLALPRLVRIGKNSAKFDWYLLSLCSAIEQQRHLGDNPPLPPDHKEYYDNGLKELNVSAITNIFQRTTRQQSEWQWLHWPPVMDRSNLVNR